MIRQQLSPLFQLFERRCDSFRYSDGASQGPRLRAGRSRCESTREASPAPPSSLPCFRVLASTSTGRERHRCRCLLFRGMLGPSAGVSSPVLRGAFYRDRYDYSRIELSFSGTVVRQCRGQVAVGNDAEGSERVRTVRGALSRARSGYGACGLSATRNRRARGCCRIRSPERLAPREMRHSAGQRGSIAKAVSPSAHQTPPD